MDCGICEKSILDDEVWLDNIYDFSTREVYHLSCVEEFEANVGMPTNEATAAVNEAL